MEEFKNSLKAKAKKIPSEYRKEKIDLNIVGPALEALKYTILEDDLREMFENLLTSSMDKRESVFPSFIDIVRQLNPDEAKLLKRISRSGSPHMPLVDLKFYEKGKKGFIVAVSNFTDIGYGVVDQPELVPEYLDDLCHFGIFKVADDMWITDPTQYDKLEKHDYIEEVKKEIGKEREGECKIQKKLLVVTDFGIAFIKSCVAEK